MQEAEVPLGVKKKKKNFFALSMQATVLLDQ